MTLAVVWNGEMRQPPKVDDLFATRRRDDTLRGLFRVVGVHGGPRYYRLTSKVLDHVDYAGPVDWELDWTTTDPTS